ncbi:unnamed protein product [Camellia sinensis]
MPFFGVAFSRTLFRYLLTIAGELRQHLEIDAHVGGVNDIAFAHPNKQLCIVTCGDDKTIKVWDANIQFIFSTAIDGKIKAWLYDFLESRVDYDAPGLWCTAMAYSADGTSQHDELEAKFFEEKAAFEESAHGLEVAEIEFSGDENEVELIKY